MTPENFNDLDQVALNLEQCKGFQKAILDLAIAPEITSGALEKAAMLVTSTVANASPVDRVSIWLFNEDESALECADLFERSEQRHSHGQRLESRDYPAYFEALGSGRAIDAADARSDPRTCEFREHYLTPLGITSMLDATIRMDGKVRGVICLEHRGDIRHWSPPEIAFAAEAADQFSFALMCNDRGQLRSLLEHAQRQESLGQLVSGIAHDFNNLLTVIMGNLDLAQLEQKSIEVSEALRAAQRASELTKRLLAIGRHQISDKKVADLARIVDLTVPFLRRVIPAQIDLEVINDATHSLIDADRSQMEQIIMNLCINARDSIVECRGRNAGKITIRIDSRDEPRSEVILSVEDNGQGIPEAMRDRIFRPFFSTKDSQSGSGLGLAVVQQIARQHEAKISVESNEDLGSIFSLTFPATSDPANLRITPATPIEPLPRTKKRILIIEDDEQVSHLTQRLLLTSGYDVMTCRNGAEAREYLEENTTDLVICDIGLPDLPGPILMEPFLAERKTAVIFTSGNAGALAELQALSSSTALLQKPFRIDELMHAIVAVLNADDVGKDQD